ncbi:hypothetical protein V501_04418 [Pseudogymnoascus sp. VKM F-4519 (FW-2642)]|nr:hypothetical protein V501_04418 [Pseudogymnoascus sp. VKM F-4519 (FW-2642)]
MSTVTPNPSPSPIDDIWSSAFTLYKQQTNRDLSSSTIPSKLLTVDDVLSEVEASHTAFGSWRSKHARVWGKLSGCIGPLEVLGDGCEAVWGAGAVFGAVVYLLRACEEVEKSYELVETLFEEMEEFTVRLKDMLEIIGRSEELIRTKRFRHFIGVAWVGKDEKTRDALDRFHKLIDSEERLVIAVTYSSVQNTEHNVDTLLSAADENKLSQKEILGKVDHLSTVATDSKEEELLKNALWTEAVPKTNEIFAEFKESSFKRYYALGCYILLNLFNCRSLSHSWDGNRVEPPYGPSMRSGGRAFQSSASSERRAEVGPERDRTMRVRDVVFDEAGADEEVKVEAGVETKETDNDSAEDPVIGV